MKRIISLIALLLGANFCAHAQEPSAAASAAAPTPATAAATPRADLIIKDTKLGAGAEATSGHVVEVRYSGWLYDAKAKNGHGKLFDSSAPKSVLSFTLGIGKVIQGWDQGVTGMREGGKRTLIIPPELGYGQKEIGGGLIPPNSTLLFDVELVKVRTK